MAEIFISYSRDDRDIAHALAVALEGAGMAVWWDRELTGGGDFAAEIERHLLAAPLVIVLWSHSSVSSDFVRDESSRARDMRKLLPVRIEDVALPLGFGTLHTLDLLDWDGDPDDDAMVELRRQVREAIEHAKPAHGGDGGASPLARLRGRRTSTDPLTRRRIQRRRLIGFGVAGIAAATGVGWSLLVDSRQQRRQRTALAHLEKALDHHFDADPPDLQKAELEYRLATDIDPRLAEAFFYWGHLTIALMERKQPKPSPSVLAGLREDALERFRQSLQLTALGRGQRAVAEEQITWLAASEPAPLERSTDAQLVAALATSPEPEPVVAGPARPQADSRPTATPAARPAAEPRPLGGLGAAAGLFGLLGKTDGKTAAPASRPPPPPPSQPDPQPVAKPRLAAASDVSQRAAAEIQALFAEDRDQRIGARSVLSGNPQLAADALPSALTAAQASLATTTPDAGARAGLAATVQLVAGATPAVVAANRTAIETLQRGLAARPEQLPAGAASTLAAALRRSEGLRPTVFIQIANERQRTLARQLLRRFEAAGYASADIENVGEKRAPSRPEVRSHGGSDPAMARWCQSKLSEVVGSDVVLRNLRDIRPDNDVFEIWFDAALCAPGGRDVAGCGKA